MRRNADRSLTVEGLAPSGGSGAGRQLVLETVTPGFGVSAADPLTVGGVTLTLVAVAAAACHLPARRAARIGPMAAIQSD